MATGSLMMGTLKGKLGETVALRRSGKQVLRAYVRDVKNPNSQKQQVQRMIQSTVAQAYSAMKKICDHSFEGVQVGQKSMSYFMSKNMNKLRASITADTDGTLTGASADFVRKGVNLPVLNEYIVAKGTLPEVSLIDSSATDTVFADSAKGIALIASDRDSIPDAVNVFVNANAAQVGDWFTFLFLLRENGSIQNGQQTYRFAFVRCVVDVDETVAPNIPVLKPSLTSVGVPSVTFRDAFRYYTDAQNNLYYVYIDLSKLLPSISDAEGDFTPVACTCIHSRQNVGGSWQRSNAEFKVRSNYESLNITWPDKFFDELATYAGSAEAKGQGDYVLNGGQ